MNGRASPPLQSPKIASANASENGVLKTATFKEYGIYVNSNIQQLQKSPEQSHFKEYAQQSNPFKKSEIPSGLVEEVTRLDLFVNKSAVNYSQISLERANEERILFQQDNKVEYWFFIIEGSVKLSYNPLKFPQVCTELQDLIQFFDYSKMRENPQLSFTFCKSSASPLSALQTKFQSPKYNEQVEEEKDDIIMNDEYNDEGVDNPEILQGDQQQMNENNTNINPTNTNNINNKQKKMDFKPKKEVPQKISQKLIVKRLGAGDIISFKELKYYNTTGICSKGTTVLKIGVTQTNNLKIHQLWQSYLHESIDDGDIQRSHAQKLNILGCNSAFDENFNDYIDCYKFVKSIPLFQSISSDVIDQCLTQVNYKQGEILYRELEIPQYLYIVYEGEVELLKASNPNFNQNSPQTSPSISPKKNFSSHFKQNQYIKASVLTPGNLFGEEEVILQSMRNFTARASSKRLVVYQLSIFFFLDCLCRQNEELLYKLKLKIQNKIQWRSDQIDSISKVQKKLSQIDSQSKSNIDLLSSNSANDLNQNASDHINIIKSGFAQSAQNSPTKRSKRSSSHMRMDQMPLKSHPKMAANPFLLPQIYESFNNLNNEEKKLQQSYQLQQQQLLSNTKENNIQQQLANVNRKSISNQSMQEKMNKSTMDLEENIIKKDVRRKQNIINMFKKNNQIVVNNKFPSFEKPLIPVDGYGLAVRTKNKYQVSNSKQYTQHQQLGQVRNSSQPSIDYHSSMDNTSNVETITSRIRNKILQNSSNANLSLHSQPSNRNFEKLISEIDTDVQKDQIRVSQIVNPMQKQLTSISQNSNAQQIPFINLPANPRILSRNSIQHMSKEQNRSMDDIYQNVDKIYPLHKQTTNVTEIDKSRINSFRNPYLDENQFYDNSLRNSFIELSPSQIGTEIDKNLYVNSKFGAYFRPSRSYLMNKMELKEKFPKGQKLQKLPTQQDISVNNPIKDRQDLKIIYNSLEKYRLLEKSPTKEYGKRKSEGYNIAIRDKIENYLNGQLSGLNSNYKVVKDPLQSQNQTIQSQQNQLGLGVLPKGSPTNNQRNIKSDQGNKIQVNHSSNVFGLPLMNGNNSEVQNSSEEVVKTRSARYQQQFEQKQRQLSNNNSNSNSNSNANNNNNGGIQNNNSFCKQNNTCECRFCIPYYRQNQVNSQNKYQLQEGGCSMQYTNKKNQILKKASQLIYSNSPSNEFIFKK